MNFRDWFQKGTILGILFLLWTPCLSADEPKTLDDVFKAALERSASVAAQGELVIQAEERRIQASGAIYPNLSGTGTFLQQEAPNTSLASNISPSFQSTMKFTAQQPLFRGFREFAAIRQQKLNLEASKFSRDQAVVQLYMDVANNFYSVQTLEQDVKNYQIEIESNRKRIEELRSFVKLGRSRATEVLTVQANLSSLQAQLQVSQGQLKVARDIFTYLTGLSSETLLTDKEAPPLDIGPLEKYLDRLALRPDIQAQERSVSSASEGISIAKGAHLPSADLYGNYYLSRPGLLSGVTWDVQLALTVPIFSGGVIQAQVRQAAAAQRQSEMNLLQTKRQAENEIRNYFNSVQADQKQLADLAQAVALSRKNYQAELHDYRLGLVTNIEVLQILTSSQVTQRLFDRATSQAKLDFIKLQIASAIRPLRIKGSDPK